MTGGARCSLCRRWLSAAEVDAHVCQLGERFFQQQIPRWRAAGVHVRIYATNYDAAEPAAPNSNGRQAAGEEKDR